MRRIRGERMTGSGGWPFVLIACALFLRLIVPAGWMPASSDGRWIELCTGMGAVTAWVDVDGAVHDEAPDPGKSKADGACVFAGFAAALAAPSSPVAIDLPLIAAAVPPMAFPLAVGIGRGLAAPPPPPTGPPAAL